ncbi:MAG TPA: DUF2946 family protein [Tepidisphaeraceae bacterium]|nr:DUF2946 family protein [Tepidisphaeraceae bacterium]
MSSAHNSFSKRIRRASVMALLLYEAFFLNILVPVHTRGSITLESGPKALSESCCAGHSSAQKTPGKEPSSRDRQNCAVCNFAARMSAPPVVCLKLPELHLVQLLPFPPPASTVSVRSALPYLSRGPPAIA